MLALAEFNKMGIIPSPSKNVLYIGCFLIVKILGYIPSRSLEGEERKLFSKWCSIQVTSGCISAIE